METDEVDRASAALASGDWEAAKDLFLAIVADAGPSAEVLDGLGRALWWLKDVPSAIEIRARAFGAYIEEGKSAQAAHLAVWLSRELRNLLRTDAAASGWLARAETAAERGRLVRRRLDLTRPRRSCPARAGGDRPLQGGFGVGANSSR